MLSVQEIKGYPLFAGLDENELAEIARICNRKSYDFNDVIFSPERPSGELYLVESGNDSIQIEIPITRDEKIVIHTLTKGETFGWASLSSYHVHTAIARCLSPVSVISMDGHSLMQLLDDDNHTGYIVMRNLMEAISARLSYTTVAFRYELRRNRKKIPAKVL